MTKKVTKEVLPPGNFLMPVISVA